VTTYSGERNPNWGGGRSIASNGYVLIRVGVDHHLADVRGYAYEHRVVAEQVIGRRLEPGEVVHHIDHDKTNNAPANLMVCTSAEHRVEHRSDACMRRLPDEPNPTILCACGCGENFDRYDTSGRPRRFVPGHNSVSTSPGQIQILEHLAHGPATSAELALALDRQRDGVSSAMMLLVGRRLVEKGNRGRWRLTESSGDQQDAGTEPDLLTIAWVAEQWQAGNLRDDDFIDAIRGAMTRIGNRQ
jgi:hypothetical protein